MASLDIEGVLRNAWRRFADDPVDFLALGLLSFVLPMLVAIAVLFAVMGSGVLIFFGAQGAQDPQQLQQTFEAMFETGQGLAGFVLTVLGGFAAAALIGGAVWSVFYGALVARAKATGETARDIGGALSTATERFLAVFGVMLVVIVVLVVLVGAPGALIAWGLIQGIQSGTGSAIAMAGFGMLGMLVGGVVALFLAISWFVAIPAVIVEDLGPWSALSRSWELVSGNRLAVLVLIIVGGIAAAILGIVVDIVFAPLQFAGADVGVISTLVSGTLGAPIWPLLSVLTYESLTGEDLGPLAGEEAEGAEADERLGDDAYVPLDETREMTPRSVLLAPLGRAGTSRATSSSRPSR